MDLYKSPVSCLRLLEMKGHLYYLSIQTFQSTVDPQINGQCAIETLRGSGCKPQLYCRECLVAGSPGQLSTDFCCFLQCKGLECFFFFFFKVG